MTGEDFEEVLESRIQRIRSVLGHKAVEYASSGDRLHNFKRASEMLRVSPEEALMGMFAKHMVSIMDMVDEGSDSPMEMWEEKIGDAINYLILLEGVIREKKNAA